MKLKPTRALAIELGELRQENEQLDKALEEAHPEGVIAALSEGYRALTEELAQKKALV
ncbi:Uncharacterised protein [Legionella hackeliae]|uniref:hypothetical protein n=1 Tax=Legionella hackeliae TaxID=449 RepID=UPI000E1963F2|nr:hypothetical protein [Legionella hackeliae]STX49793.1 Uncharacterised protein [Legionella hackeliae]